MVLKHSERPDGHKPAANCRECAWETDGTVVWCQGCGSAVAASRDLSDREGRLAPLTSVEDQARNMRLVALAPTLARSLEDVLEVFRTCVGADAWAEFAGNSRDPEVCNTKIVAALVLVDAVRQVRR